MQQKNQKAFAAIIEELEADKALTGFINDGAGDRYHAAVLLMEIADYTDNEVFWDFKMTSCRHTCADAYR